ncbi:MAG: hypothetical protein KGJ86_04595 [Chloroflexota bacterium]|nr:hypothetical protein [Chloroflexota bacterium]
MAKPTDVADPELRSLLVSAEEALDEGDYSTCVRKSVEAYGRLIERQPDLFIPPPAPGQMPLPRPGEVRVPNRSQMRPWPALCGVVVELDARRKALVKFEKDRFIMTEAMTCLEYALDAIVSAQRRAE